MTIGKTRLVGTLLPAIFALLLGCEPSPEAERAMTPRAIESGDECHVCGMIIERFPGPKAQAFVRHRDEPLKFCSTRDLFAWLLQPETQAVVQAAFVHDMGATAWERPADDAFVPADKAWYVAGSDRTGAMGPTLASFADRGQARVFAERHGGRVIGFDDIDLELLSSLDESGQMLHEGGAGSMEHAAPASHGE